VDEHPRPPLETLPCTKTCKNKEKVEAATEFLKNMSSVIAKKAPSQKVSFGGNSTESVKRLSKITITPERVAKVVPNRIFSVTVHPTEEKVLVATGGKWGGIGLWDVKDTEGENHGVQLFTPHNSPVNCLTWDKFNSSSLISTSYDGTVRTLDIEKQQHRLIFGDTEGGYSTYHCQTGQNTFLITRGSCGMVGLVDSRVSNVKMAQDYQVFHRTSPKTVDLHPVQQNYFLCPNNKAGCSIFDMRKGSGKAVMSPVCEFIGHTKALSSAMFSPLTGNRVATVAYDDKLRLYDTSNLSGKILPCSQVRHNNQTGRWLTTLKVHWHPRQDDMLFIGSMERPRQIEAFRAGEGGLGMIKALRGEDLGSVCSVVAVHPSMDVVVGGNSSGRVHVFM